MPPPYETDPERARRAVLLAWFPLCLVLFGGGGAFVIHEQWGFADPAVLIGAAGGLACVAALSVWVGRRWDRRLGPDELRRSRRIAASGGGPWPGLVIAVVVVANAASGFVGGAAFSTAFATTFATGATVLGFVIVLGRRGLWQRDDPRL